MTDRYVIVVWNQAGGHPRLTSSEIYDDLADAYTDRDGDQAQFRAAGRGDEVEVMRLEQV